MFLHLLLFHDLDGYLINVLFETSYYGGPQSLNRFTVKISSKSF